MLTPAELHQRCVQLGILNEGADAKWNGMALETDGAWFMQPSPKQFPDRIARVTHVDGDEVVDVYDESGFLFRIGDAKPDEPADAV